MGTGMQVCVRLLVIEASLYLYKRKNKDFYNYSSGNVFLAQERDNKSAFTVSVGFHLRMLAFSWPVRHSNLN